MAEVPDNLGGSWIFELFHSLFFGETAELCSLVTTGENDNVSARGGAGEQNSRADR